ncbi:MAG: phosphoribosylglycinamide formyltransferase [Coriobacteriia bacterium]|nr:phosphoribosylglycinamide formyltransferase [Coriobacteriia bacterium]
MGERLTRFGFLISGSGTNLQAVIDAIDEGRIQAELAIVVSSRPDAYGLVRAAKSNIPTASLSRSVYQDALAADAVIARLLLQADVDYVVLAGYMRKVLSPLLEAFPQRIINLHPALLPSFPGAQGIADAFSYGVKVTGVTVHFADAEYDNGPIIAQRAVEVLDDDTLDSLTERIHQTEHQLLPEVLALIATNKVLLASDGKVSVVR